MSRSLEIRIAFRRIFLSAYAAGSYNLEIANCDFKSGARGRRTRPRVFTEQGVAMLSSVLKSPTAVRVNIEIMRAFVRLPRLMATPGDLVEQIRKLAETVQLHDHDIKVISHVLQQVTEKPVATPRPIRFHATDLQTDHSSPRSLARMTFSRSASSFSKPRSAGR
jgi:hypothetical protein